MKKILFLFLVAFQMMNATEKDSLQANYSFKRYYQFKAEEFFDDDCDACGCSANMGNMGFGSMLNDYFVGVRYIYQNYSSKQGVFKDSPWINEYYNATQIWGRFPISDKVQMTGLIPYNFNHRTLASGPQDISGLGDMTFMALYSVYETSEDSVTYHHNVKLGGGIKMPTGKYDNANNGTLNPSFQLGTGSWDFPLVAEYTLKRKQLGLYNTLNYLIKTENKDYFQYGNQFNYGSSLFYILALNNLNLVPQTGIMGEVYAENKQMGQAIPDTKGQVLFSKFGLEVGSGKFSLGMNGMFPINQSLTGGNVKVNSRLSINLNYSL